MPLTVLDCKGISAARQERIEAAVAAAGPGLAQPYEAWIAADPSQGGARAHHQAAGLREDGRVRARRSA
jgi:hypothetical protein